MHHMNIEHQSWKRVPKELHFLYTNYAKSMQLLVFVHMFIRLSNCICIL